MRWVLIAVIAAVCVDPLAAEEQEVVVSPATLLAPRYVLSDGFDFVARLDFEPDGTFRFLWLGCTGVTAQASGRYEASADSVRLIPNAVDFRRDPRMFAESMHRLRWGEREYLVPEERMLAFANAINAGREPRSHVIGAVFYLRAGDESKPVSGLPPLPGRWQDLVLTTPLAGTVAKVVQRETKTRRPIVVIDRGSRAGLRAGMTLVAVNPRRPHFSADLTVLSVGPESADAEVDFQYNHIRVCDVWKTKRTAEAAQRADAADEALLSACLARKPRS